MKNRRILIWIAIGVVAGSAIAFLGYRLHMAKRKYVSTDGGFSLLLPRGCESPMISHDNADDRFWLWFCQDGVRVVIRRQPWEEVRRKVRAEATKKSGAVPPDELVEATAAAFMVAQYFESGGLCATLATGAGNFGTREFNTTTRELTIAKVVVDGRYNAHYTNPVKLECNLGYTVEAFNVHIMVLFAVPSLYVIVLTQPNTAHPVRWNDLVQSFHVL